MTRWSVEAYQARGRYRYLTWETVIIDAEALTLHDSEDFPRRKNTMWSDPISYELSNSEEADVLLRLNFFPHCRDGEGSVLFDLVVLRAGVCQR